MIQVATRHRGWGAARTALSVGIAPVERDVRVTLAQQRWADAAASLVITGLGALLSPLSLLGPIDDIARDVGKLTSPDQVWETVEHYSDSVRAKLGMWEKELVVTCAYCGVGNEIGLGKCSACGGSLAKLQPIACPQWGLSRQEMPVPAAAVGPEYHEATCPRDVTSTSLRGNGRWCLCFEDLNPTRAHAFPPMVVDPGPRRTNKQPISEAIPGRRGSFSAIASLAMWVYTQRSERLASL